MENLKAGDILIATDPCVMLGKPTLIVGKAYKVTAIDAEDDIVWIHSERKEFDTFSRLVSLGHPPSLAQKPKPKIR